MEYTITEKDGIRMIDCIPLNKTGTAEAYYTVSFNVNIYKIMSGLETSKKNFATFCSVIGTDPGKVISNRLTHHTDIVRCVNSNDIIDIFDEPIQPHADGLVTDDPGITLFLYAADCAIIGAVDPVNRVIGCCHAGWRGSLGKIIPNLIDAMESKYGSDRNDIVVQLMPMICTKCFEVNEDVAKQFASRGFAEYIVRSNGKPHIDLAGVNYKQLLDAGIRKRNLHNIELCTFCHNDLFESYRRGPIDEHGVHMNGANGFFIKLR